MKLHTKARRARRGAALIEYGLLVAGIAIVALAAVSIFGHKVSDLFGLSSTVLPGAHAEDNGPIKSGRLVATENGALKIDAQDPNSLSKTLGVDQDTMDSLIINTQTEQQQP
ncbi:MAG: hypothetical protein R3F34_08910 [Planctomycetota bacterium]